MRILVPAVALLLGAAAWMARAKDVEFPRCPVPSRPIAGAIPAAERAAEPVVERASAPAPRVDAKPAASVPPVRPLTGSTMAARLAGNLDLSEEQARQVTAILQDRARDVAAYEAEVRVRGWIRIEEFDRRIGEIRRFAYDRIASTLNARQGDAFAAARPELAREDFLSIAIPENEVISLD